MQHLSLAADTSTLHLRLTTSYPLGFVVFLIPTFRGDTFSIRQPGSQTPAFYLTARWQPLSATGQPNLLLPPPGGSTRSGLPLRRPYNPLDVSRRI